MEKLATCWVRERLDEVCLKKSNRVEKEDYTTCCFWSKKAQWLDGDWLDWVMDGKRMARE